MADGLEIRIAADVASALSSLREVQKQLKQTAGAGNETGKGLGGLDDKFKKLPNTVGQTNAALTNFGRVIQDAPYGIIGIANNIDPLVTSFNQLKASTGSTKAALSELIAGLAGPAGIAIAVSTITSLFVKFGDQLFSSSKKMNEAELSSISYSGSIERITDSLNKLRSELEFGNAITKIDNELKGLTGSALDIANAQTEIGSNNKYITELDNKIAPLKAKFNEAATEAKKYLQETQKFKEIPAEKFAAGAQEYILGKRTELNAFYSYYLEFGKISDDLLKKLSKSDQIRFADLQKSNAELFKLEDERLSFENKNVLLEKKILLDRYNQQKEIIDKTIAEAKKISAFAGKVISIRFDVSPLDDDTTIYKKAKDYLEKFKKGLYSFTLDVPPPEIEIPKTFSDDVKNEATAAGQLYAIEFANAAKPKNIGVGETLLEIDAKKLLKKQQEIRKLGEAVAAAFNEGAKKIATGGLVSIGEAIGNLFAGGDVKNALQGFAQVIGGGLKAIGEQIIAIGVAALLAKDALKGLFAKPYLAIAAGIALVAAGSAMQSALSKGLPGRATGGPVSGNTPYLVGERGPELFVPAVSGSIIPNNQAGSFMGGRMMGGNGGGGSILRGQDIILAYARTQRSQLRVNG